MAVRRWSRPQSPLDPFGVEETGGIRASLFRGAGWSFAGAVLSRGAMLVASILIARILGKTRFGQWGLIVSTVGMFSLLATLGLGVTLTKHVAEFRRSDPARAGRILSLVLVAALSGVSLVALMCVASAPLLARYLFGVQALALPLMMSAAVVFSMVAAFILEGGLAGFEAFSTIARVNVVQGVVLLVTVLPLTWAFELVGAVIAVAIFYLAGAVLYLHAILALSREHGMAVSLRGAWSERTILRRYALPSVLGDGASAAAAILSQAVAAKSPTGMPGLGGYQASVNWRDIVLFIPAAIKRVTLPMLSRIQGRGDRDQFVSALLANVALNGGIATLGALPLMAMSPWLLALYGPAFKHDWDMMIIMLAAGVVQSVRDVLMQVTGSLGRLWFNFAASMTWATCLMVGTLLLVPRFGVRAYCWVWLAAMVVSLGFYLLSTLKLMNAGEAFRSIRS